MRALLTALCRLLLRVFFRRIERIGVEQVPIDAPILYVLNHPNGLIDPLFILCLSPRPVTFLAKAPLFSTFLVQHFVRAFECLPVYREQDGEDPSKNRASIEAAIALLASGKALALFPEGTSHSDPQLRPLKTGAARIALSSSASANGRTPTAVVIVPVGLVYSDKTTFRSHARLVYGQPIPTPRVELDPDSRPPLAAAIELTAAIDEGLDRVTLQARTHEAIELARAAASIFTAADRERTNPDPVARFELEHRLVRGYEHLREHAPIELARVVARINAYAGKLALLDLPLDSPATLERRSVLRYAARRLVALALLFGPAIIGLLTHYPSYRAIGWLAHRVAKRSTDVLATLELIAGLLLIPATWLLVSVTLGLTLGWGFALLGLAILPGCGYAALRFTELFVELLDRARGAWSLLSRREIADYLVDERQAIRSAILDLDAKLPG